MKILAELSEKSLGLNDEQVIVGENFKLRKSARAIILNADGQMAVQHIRKYNYHKLPGGEMEAGEEIEDTLHREIKEEVGCTIEMIQSLGVVIEYHQGCLHMSYCFVAKVHGEIGEPKFDAGEVENDQRTIWMMPEKCLETLQADLVSKAEGNFIVQREIMFLSEFLSL